MDSELVLHPSRIYSLLGIYIQKSFFSNDKRGDEVFPLIDTYFIESFCTHHGITITDFTHFIQQKSIWNVRDSSLFMEILGFIGTQLYAASKMENSSGYTASNFRDRICSPDILNIDLNEWQQWAVSYQDKIWKKYYDWCSTNGFVIANKCTPIQGQRRDRYVQYPKVHSKLVLNREDLKKIATFFVEKKLYPNEDISEQDFWNIVGRYHFNSYYSNRSQRILEENRELANKQIYQYYLFWDGEYTDNFHTKKITKAKNQLYLLELANTWSIDIIENESGKLIKNIPFRSLKNKHEFREYYTYKRDNVILFKKSNDYDGYWEESRYIDNYEDEGIALFSSNSRNYIYYEKDVIKKTSGFVLVKISHSSTYYEEFYANERPYTLRGGLKVAQNTYLLGAPPLLEFKKTATFWIDDKEEVSYEGAVYSFDLNEGCHQIKIKGYKSINICITKVFPVIHMWGEHSKWRIAQGKSAFWTPQSTEGNVTGIDFSSYSLISNDPKEINPLTLWCRKELFAPIATYKERNITLKNTK